MYLGSRPPVPTNETIVEQVSSEEDALQRALTELDEGHEELEVLFRELPVDLVKFWVARFNNEEKGLSVEEKGKKLGEVIEKRKRQSIIGDIEYMSLPQAVKDRILETLIVLTGDRGNFVELGAGKYAQVTEDPETSSVALKFPFEQDNIKQHRDAVKKEVGFLEQLHGFSHEFVQVPYLYAFRTDTPPYFIAMERVKGASFKDIIEKKQGLSFEDRQRLVEMLHTIGQENLLATLETFFTKMHTEQEIIHGDIHPGNIMIDNTGEVFVIDFGKTVHSPKDIDESEHVDGSLLAYEGTTTIRESKDKELQALKETVEQLYRSLTVS